MGPILKRALSVFFAYKEIIILFILTCIFFSPVILHLDQMIYPPGNVMGNDITAYVSFFRTFIGTTILNGHEIPLWNPYVFSGTPLIGNPQAQLFSPFVWPFILSSSPLLFGWVSILDVFLLGLFTFLFARSIHMSPYASLFSAITFMFSATVILRIYAGHLPIIEALVWFPLILLFFERSFTNNKILSGTLAGIAMALMVFGGGLQIALYATFLSYTYLIIRTFCFTSLPSFREKLRHFAFVGLISLFIFLVLSAVQVMPILEYSQFSNRAEGIGYEFSTWLSFPPENIVTVVLPDYFGNPLGPLTLPLISPFISYWELALYLGIIPLILVVIAVIFRPNRYEGLFLFFALFALLFSMGAYVPLYRFFYDFIPGFSAFRIPSRMLFAFTFSLSIVAGFGIDAILNRESSKENRFISFFNTLTVRKTCIVLLVISALVLGLAGFTGTLSPVYYTFSVIGWCSCAAVFCIVPSLLQGTPLHSSRVNIVKILLICILITDLFLFGMRFVDTKSPQEVYQTPEYMQVIANETDKFFRVYDETDYLNQRPYIAYRNNISLISGYDPIYLKEYQVYFIRSQQQDYSGYNIWVQGSVITDFNIMRSLNVRYIVTNRKYDSDLNVQGLNHVFNSTEVQVYRINSTLPRAYVIPVTEFTNNTPIEFRSAEIKHYSPNTIIVDTNTTTPGYLILSEIWYPGWSAQDNGKSVVIERYQNVFRAVPIDPGIHRISFSYFPAIHLP